MLHIEGLSFGFSKNPNFFSEDVKRGSIVFILGANGSGKTSLQKTMAGLLPPLAGTVNFSENLPSEVRPLYLPAHPDVSDWLTGHDVFDIFSTGPSQWKFQEDIEALELSSILARPLHQLSLGEQKRIFLGASLACPSQVLFLDEPLNSLDWNMELVLYRILQRHSLAKRSFFIAAHQLQWVSRFSNSIVWFLDGFSRLKSGSPEEVLTSPEVQAVFNFRVKFTDNPLDGSRIIATSESKGTYETKRSLPNQ